MIEKRARRAQRLIGVLTQLHRVEEQKKIELERRFQALEESQEDVIRALNKDDALHGLFIDTTARLLRNLAQEAQRVAEARDAQSRKLLDHAAKVKTAERLHDSLGQTSARIRRENELREAIERYVRSRGASLP